MFEKLKTNIRRAAFPGSTPNLRARHSVNSAGNQGRPFRPNCDHLEVLRRSKLTRILRDVQRVVAYDGIPGSDELQRLVTLCAAELSTIERAADASERMPEWVSWIEFVLGIDPFEAYALWMAHAPSPIRRAADRFHAHQTQAVLKSEPARFFHEKLVDPAAISALLGLTRKRNREIFGSGRCVLPPIRETASRFTARERSEIRELSNRIDLTPEYLRDLASVEGGEMAFCDKVLGLELQLAKQDEIDRARIPNASDLYISRAIGRSIGKIQRRPGPKPSAVTVKGLIWETASRMRVSADTVNRQMRVVREAAHEGRLSELHLNSTVVAPEFLRSAIPGFQHSFETGFGCDKIAETRVVLRLVEATYQRRKTYAFCPHNRDKRSNRYAPETVEMVQEFWRATRNENLPMRRIYHFGACGAWKGYVETARQWHARQDCLAKEVAADAAVGHVTLHVVEIETDAEPSVGSVRGHDGRPAAAPRSITQTEGYSDGRG